MKEVLSMSSTHLIETMLATGLVLLACTAARAAGDEGHGAPDDRSATTVELIPNTSLPIPSTIPSTTMPQTISTTTSTMPADECGDANGDGDVSAADALYVLKAAVGGIQDCVPKRCDANGNGDVGASDALRILRHAVGENVSLICDVL
jgi:hypothetical protein